MKYIDADRFLKDETKRCGYIPMIGGCTTDNESLAYQLAKAPKADVVEVRHGHNATSMHPVDEFVCSVCGFICNDYTEAVYDEDGDYTYYRECEFKYCPNCGAKMDEGVKEDEK